MSESPKISVILGGNQPDKTADILRQANAEWDNHVKLVAFEMKRKKMMYDEAIKAGFTEQQALTLIK